MADHQQIALPRMGTRTRSGEGPRLPPRCRSCWLPWPITSRSPSPEWEHVHGPGEVPRLPPRCRSCWLPWPITSRSPSPEWEHVHGRGKGPPTSPSLPIVLAAMADHQQIALPRMGTLTRSGEGSPDFPLAADRAGCHGRSPADRPPPNGNTYTVGGRVPRLPPRCRSCWLPWPITSRSPFPEWERSKGGGGRRGSSPDFPLAADRAGCHGRSLADRPSP